MKKRPLSWVLLTAFFAGLSILVAPGCSRSIRGEYEKICIAYCEAGDDCEDYTNVPVDRDDCITDCANDAEDAEEAVLDDCEDGVDIDGSQVDRCLDAISVLGQVCRDDDESELLEALGDVADECQNQDFYDCR
ncbi:MAG: hypothetical protein IPK82_37480 [Polyangiaceae bacterium]|nr:hypothetical protein [Polyangiaceae bacterium]